MKLARLLALSLVLLSLCIVAGCDRRTQRSAQHRFYFAVRPDIGFPLRPQHLSNHLLGIRQSVRFTDSKGRLWADGTVFDPATGTLHRLLAHSMEEGLCCDWAYDRATDTVAVLRIQAESADDYLLATVSVADLRVTSEVKLADALPQGVKIDQHSYIRLVSAWKGRLYVYADKVMYEGEAGAGQLQLWGKWTWICRSEAYSDFNANTANGAYAVHEDFREFHGAWVTDLVSRKKWLVHGSWVTISRDASYACSVTSRYFGPEPDDWSEEEDGLERLMLTRMLPTGGCELKQLRPIPDGENERVVDIVEGPTSNQFIVTTQNWEDRSFRRFTASWDEFREVPPDKRFPATALYYTDAVYQIGQGEGFVNSSLGLDALGGCSPVCSYLYGDCDLDRNGPFTLLVRPFDLRVFRDLREPPVSTLWFAMGQSIVDVGVRLGKGKSLLLMYSFTDRNFIEMELTLRPDTGAVELQGLGIAPLSKARKDGRQVKLGSLELEHYVQTCKEVAQPMHLRDQEVLMLGCYDLAPACSYDDGVMYTECEARLFTYDGTVAAYKRSSGETVLWEWERESSVLGWLADGRVIAMMPEYNEIVLVDRATFEVKPIDLDTAKPRLDSFRDFGENPVFWRTLGNSTELLSLGGGTVGLCSFSYDNRFYQLERLVGVGTVVLRDRVSDASYLVELAPDNWLDRQ